MSVIRKFNHFLIYDFDYEESWLNDLSSEGLLLTGAGIRGYEFEQSDNRERRYRVIPKGSKDISEEELQLYKDEGWDTVFDTQDKTIFYTDDPGAAEILTDKESYLDYLSKARRKFLRVSMLCGFVVALWTANLIINMPGNQTSLPTLSEKSMIGEISYIVLLLCLILMYAVQGAGYMLCRKRMLQYNGTPVKLQYKDRRAAVSMISNILLIIVIATCMGFFGSSSKVKREALQTYNEPYPVLMREWSPEEWDFASSHTEKFSLDDPKGVRYDCQLYNSSNLTLKKGYGEEIYWSESMGYADDKLPQYTSLTYDFRSEDTAAKMLLNQVAIDMELRRGSEEALAGMSDITIDVPDIDYAGYYEARSGNVDYQYLYLRRGSVVVYVSYSGERSLKDGIDLFAKQLGLSGENQ